MAKVEDREMGALKAVFLLKHGSSFITNDDYSLYESTTLDSVTTINIFNDLSRFQIFRKAPMSIIQCHDDVAIKLGF